MTYGTMWFFNVRFDTSFFAIAFCVMSFMKSFLIHCFANAMRNLSDYLAARKRIEVRTNRLRLIFTKKKLVFLSSHSYCLTNANEIIDYFPHMMRKQSTIILKT